ncbi:very-long-chain 3-oxoacyl-CoA reductase-B-like [Dendronephthya gigantea]|uniref:very-long-chain 3-oxoacyl-CoA reductase-B-like n=1 Tax=Dendronephthya gigantea TaxID=151771 RepID=UPI00106D27F7|nr:very-long-chain 3-oxoacyl-CoA reductase-B-like [Dendronephthya gigantea]
MSFADVTCLIGTLCVWYLSFKLLKLVLDVIRTTLLGGNLDFRRYGEWAVVTGSTDGIGKEYAKQLAAKGLNIILMSRSQEKLDAVASEIESEHKVKTKVIKIDFSGGHEIYEPIAKELEGFEIGVLVNNVGFALPYPAFFHEVSVENIWRQINVNVMSTTMLTKLIIPSMVVRKKGIIINVASVAAIIPISLLGPYSGTKAFMDKLSESLQIEYGDKGIIVQSVLPCFVATKMSGIKTSGLFTPFPDSYVRSVLRKVGVSKQCHGYWPHDLQGFIASLVPVWLMRLVVMKGLLALRDEALEKRKEKKES